jgi:hypothetical protein
MEKKIIEQKIIECEHLWSKYSCDCLHYMLLYLENELKKIK